MKTWITYKSSQFYLYSTLSQMCLRGLYIQPFIWFLLAVSASQWYWSGFFKKIDFTIRARVHSHIFSTSSLDFWKLAFQLSFRASQRLSCDVWMFFLLKRSLRCSLGVEVLWLLTESEWTLVAFIWTLNRPTNPLQHDLTACFYKTDECAECWGASHQLWIC